MQLSDLPRRFPIPFGNNAGASYIRTVPTDHVAASTTDAPASLYDGFPPETFAPLGSGGIPPNGADFNGILNQLSAWARWAAAGGAALYDGTFAAAIGGYPKGARITSTANPGLVWVNQVDGNTTNPDSGGATNWTALGDIGHDFTPTGGHFTIGPVIFNFGEVALTDNTGKIAVTFDEPFNSVVLMKGAVNNSGAANPSSWSGVGNVNLLGMTVGMSIPAAGGGAGAPAGIGTSSFWWAVGI